MYVKVCKDCYDNHHDIITKKISKGVIWDASITSDKMNCYLEHMHEEDNKAPEGSLHINFYQEKGWQHTTGFIDMEGYTSLTELLNDKRFVMIETDGIKTARNTSKITWACEVKKDD